MHKIFEKIKGLNLHRKSTNEFMQKINIISYLVVRLFLFVLLGPLIIFCLSCSKEYENVRGNEWEKGLEKKSENKLDKEEFFRREFN